METVHLELREVIKSVTRRHLSVSNGLAFGQCLTAVGWVGGTLPEMYENQGMVELSMADVAGGGFVVGAALAGRRPFYIIRYQGFNWFNAPIIINYACKSKEIWGRPCPIFIRSIAMEGGIGPVAGSSHHSLYFRMPGVKILSPMTPAEYESAYKEFMSEDEVYYISEHRGSFGNKEELPNIVYEDPDYVLFPVSITRFSAQEASKELYEKYDLKVAVHHIFRIKPFAIDKLALRSLKASKYGACVLDDDYTDGVCKSMAYELAKEANVKALETMGLENKSAGFGRGKDNLPPNKEKIMQLILNKVGILPR